MARMTEVELLKDDVNQIRQELPGIGRMLLYLSRVTEKIDDNEGLDSILALIADRVGMLQNDLQRAIDGKPTIVHAAPHILECPDWDSARKNYELKEAA